MNSKHRKTLRLIFTDPVSGNIPFSDIEALLVAVGAELSTGRGSRIRFDYGEESVYFHRPHPEKEALRYRVRDAREFLIRIGVTDEKYGI
ncbi:type II toxin-antitoxin system HicA family toxin [Desulfosarcina sp. OttesenSCG-928-G10]|nr:type II toxin-antitoxin system HicA family toxin [Desulfosarcina sp. OttesenSCG-928-G10]